jgi:streptomycin 6-kinase
VELPAGLSERITNVHGEAGAAWLARLPLLLADAERRWHVTLGPPFELSYNYVAPAARLDGPDAVLKAGFPSQAIGWEIDALHHFDGRGAVSLLDVDREAGILILERLSPGTSLVDVDDVAATEVAASVMRRLWRQPPLGHSFPSVAGWADSTARLRATHDGGAGPLPERLVTRAEGLLRDLLDPAPESVVLHGDLHHSNILRAEREPWLAIDPKGVIGEPACEVGAYLLNPWPDVGSWPDLPRVSRRRVDQLSDSLAIARERLVAWGIVRAVTSACWNLVDHGGGWEPAMHVAEVLAGSDSASPVRHGA